MSLTVLAQHLAGITDTRQAAKITYPLFDILFMTITAVIAGCEGWEEIEDFGHARLDWLKRYGGYENGIPIHDTIARVLSRIEPEALQSSLIQWMKDTEANTERQVIAVDGKTLRSSYRPGDRQSTIHIVSAFATANGVVMGQWKTEEKSNEINAIPELLSLLDLQDSLVTLDAMGCQRTIAQTILDKKGDYLQAVKGNQKTLYQAIRSAFGSADEPRHRQIESGHGRQEYREHHVLDAGEIAGLPHWPGLKTVGVALRYSRNKAGKEELQYRYYISSAVLSEEAFAHSVRSHWDIENRLHWVLDVALREGACKISRGHGANNLATLRHVALNQLRRETTRKAGIRRKQRLAAMDVGYLEKVIHA
ncbi:ISAs1 family transposase [Marinobacterium weihaiense]|uniref:ISAs1 family transposase n=1 Tax=Marinobacterium weihaiense TaxID=2851016 RepID=A0ABS6M9L8_9GAMM|nr:ISAs1 family transposase [Marinobacterium weihaiense]MBV0932982.1 ISAs1 family transposase [Marinobacterium weihaiense]